MVAEANDPTGDTCFGDLVVIFHALDRPCKPVVIATIGIVVQTMHYIPLSWWATRKVQRRPVIARKHTPRYPSALRQAFGRHADLCGQATHLAHMYTTITTQNKSMSSVRVHKYKTKLRLSHPTQSITHALERI